MTASLPSDAFGPDSVPVAAADDVTTFSAAVLGRRRLLQAGGLAAAAAALLAACGGDSPAAEGQVPQVGVGGAPSSAPAVPLSDVTLLRTASSVARMVVAAHEALLGSGLLTTPALIEAAQLFRDQHVVHAAALDEAVERAGGEPYPDANPLLVGRVLEPGAAALTDEVSAIALARQVEELAADTYQLFVPLATTGDLRQQMMQLGGVVGRHVAVLALNLPYGRVVDIPDTAVLPDGATTTTSTTAVGAVVPDPVYAVPGSFGSTATGVGPSYYV